MQNCGTYALVMVHIISKLCDKAIIQLNKVSTTQAMFSWIGFNKSWQKSDDTLMLLHFSYVEHELV